MCLNPVPTTVATFLPLFPAWRPAVNVEDCQRRANSQATFTFQSTKLPAGVPPQHHVESNGKKS